MDSISIVNELLSNFLAYCELNLAIFSSADANIYLIYYTGQHEIRVISRGGIRTSIN